MKIGIAILCRYSSTRLPGKILREIHGRSVLGHIIDRVRRGAPSASIVVCTSTDSSDDVIAQFAFREKVNCFRGHLEDVAGRVLTCAEEFGWDYIVRINGDNIFTDPDTLQCMIAIASTDEFDFVTNVPGRTFPLGMSVEILRTSFYREVISEVREPGYREHVTSWLYDNPEVGRRFIYRNTVCPAAAGLDLALDTEADLALAARIIKGMERSPEFYGLHEIAHMVRSEPVASPWKGRHGPLLIAEIGGNHEGDFSVARSMTEKAISARPDFIKFQLYRGDTLVSPVESPTRHAHFRRFELAKEQHIELARMCREAGIGYMASVWDAEMLEWIDEWMPIYKVGSGDLTAWPLIRKFAERGKPIILSTGLGTLDEVIQTVRFIQDVDGRYHDPSYLCLLQCTSMYPIPESEANLRVMSLLRDKTGLAVGYSDHTEGGAALRVAAAMGAEVLEFHFTDDRAGKVFRDHKVSLTPKELVELRADLDRIHQLQGSSRKVPQPSEVSEGHVQSFRRAVYPVRDIAAGGVIGEDDLTILRPNHGIDARDYSCLVGQPAPTELRAFAALPTDLLQPADS